MNKKGYVGCDFILSANSEGLTIKRNDMNSGCVEFFKWEDIKDVLSMQGKDVYDESELRPEDFKKDKVDPYAC